jgi:hypothetical protein
MPPVPEAHPPHAVLHAAMTSTAITAERYGYINRALPDADLDGIVDALACRIVTSRFTCANSPGSPADRTSLLTASSKTGCHSFLGRRVLIRSADP